VSVYNSHGTKRRRCIKCGSTLSYIRIKTHERVCRNCGHIELIEVEKEEEIVDANSE